MKAAYETRPASWRLHSESGVYPDRPLTAEIASILDIGYLRGADLWHLAVALFVDPSCEIDFLSLDVQQLEIGRRVGFGPR